MSTSIQKTSTATLFAAFLSALLLAFSLPSAQPQDSSAPTSSANPEGPQEGPVSMMFRLHSGQVLWGNLRSHSLDGIEVLRLDTGGLARLPWGFLDPKQAEELRLLHGYIEADGEELMVEAKRLRLVNGAEIIGVIDGRSDEFLYLRTASARLPIPLANIVGAPTRVQVPALDVFSKEELYQRKAQELASGLAAGGSDGALAHVELALFAEGLFDYSRALEHFQKASVADPSHRTEFVQASVARTTEKSALQEQVDFLGEIERLRSRRRFADAIELLGQFSERFPGSPLTTDWNRLRERVAVHQERTLREEVVRQWHSNAVKLTREMVRKAETYEDVLGQLDGAVTEAIEAKLVENLQGVAPGLETEDVRRFWEERGRGRIRSSSYSLGTWLLGEDRALSVPQDKEDEKSGAGNGTTSTARSDARKELEERLGRYLRNQEIQQRASGGSADDSAESPEDFWNRWSLSSRAQWALAYLVEFSGDFQVARVRLSNCRECGGTGAKEIVFTGSAIADSNSGSRLFRCLVCHGLGRVRRIQYR